MTKIPEHYKGRYEPKDYIRDHGLNFNLGCVIKYITRAGRKVLNGHTPETAKLEDLKKARDYINFEIEHLTKNQDMKG